MNPCDECVVNTLRYLDNDLKEEELQDLRSHLESCAKCRAYVTAEKALSQTLHCARPLYSAPAGLRERVAVAAAEYPVWSRVQDPPYRRPYRVLGERLSGTLQHLSSWRVLAPAALVIAICLVLIPETTRQVQAASYVETAVATHRSYLNGGLPLGLHSNSPEQVTAWFAGKVPFEFHLPKAESTPENKPVYRLTGASLVNYKGSPAALVIYETRNDKISLLVDSSSSAVVAGGDEIRAGKLTLHYRNDAGFRVITWINHGLSYALVSSVLGPARASCMVCHQDMGDRSDFKVRP
jgi:anti-sigma factor RsiW